MITLEDGTGKADANSYVDSAGAFFADYLAGHLYGSALSAASSDDKERAVRMATRVLDANVIWNGYRNKSTQALEWPRQGIIVDEYVVESTVIPVPIQQATVELALALIRRDRTDESYAQPVQKLNLGDGALQLDLGEGSASAPVDHFIPEAVSRLIAKYGRRRGTGGRQRQVLRT